MTDRNDAEPEAFEVAFHELADSAYKRLLTLRRMGSGDLLAGDAEDYTKPILKSVLRIDTVLETKPSDARLILAMAGDVVIQLAVLLIRADAELPAPRLVSP